jgi:hypothetical protein
VSGVEVVPFEEGAALDFDDLECVAEVLLVEDCPGAALLCMRSIARIAEDTIAAIRRIETPAYLRQELHPGSCGEDAG